LATENSHFEHRLLGYYLRGLGFFELGDLSEGHTSLSTALEQFEQLSYIHSPQISMADLYDTYSRILTALDQTELANDYRDKAYQDLLRRANLIADEALRHNFLNNIPLNRKLSS
jgi:hypothetical protein